MNAYFYKFRVRKTFLNIKQIPETLKDEFDQCWYIKFFNSLAKNNHYKVKIQRRNKEKYLQNMKE